MGWQQELGQVLFWAYDHWWQCSTTHLRCCWAWLLGFCAGWMVDLACAVRLCCVHAGAAEHGTNGYVLVSYISAADTYITRVNCGCVHAAAFLTGLLGVCLLVPQSSPRGWWLIYCMFDELCPVLLLQLLQLHGACLAFSLCCRPAVFYLSEPCAALNSFLEALLLQHTPLHRRLE
jgi:hypothetical protein